MNILFVNEVPFNPSVGGIERVTDILTKELLVRGVSVFYLCSRVDDIKTLAYDFPTDQIILPYEGVFNNPKNIDFYKNLLVEKEINIVVNQRGWAPFMDNILQVNGVKTVSVIHTIPMAMHILHMKSILYHNKTCNGVLRYYLKLLLYPLYYLYKEKRSIDKLFTHYNKLVKESSAIVLLSNKCRDEFLSTLNLSYYSHKVLSIPNPNTFSHANVDLEQKEKIILYVGRISNAEKNLTRLLQVWTRLYEMHSDWKLVFVGDGDSMQSLKTYVKRCKLPRVFFLGHKSDVTIYYHKASFICLTSNFEGWGMSLTEGMTYGCIPMTFNNYGAAYDIIDDGINGCLIPAFDVSIYAKRMSFLIRNKQKRMEMAMAAMKKVQSFSIDKVILRWMSLFKSLA